MVRVVRVEPPENAGNRISEAIKLNIFRGGRPPGPLEANAFGGRLSKPRFVKSWIRPSTHSLRKKLNVAKMDYDIIQMGSKGVNWVQRLPNYQGILNEDPKEVLAYKTSFEVYFARKVIRTTQPWQVKRWSKMLANVTDQKATEDGALNMPP